MYLMYMFIQNDTTFILTSYYVANIAFEATFRAISHRDGI